jgi:hypothetical protein
LNPDLDSPVRQEPATEARSGTVVCGSRHKSLDDGEDTFGDPVFIELPDMCQRQEFMS